MKPTFYLLFCHYKIYTLHRISSRTKKIFVVCCCSLTIFRSLEGYQISIKINLNAIYTARGARVCAMKGLTTAYNMKQILYQVFVSQPFSICCLHNFKVNFGILLGKSVFLQHKNLGFMIFNEIVPYPTISTGSLCLIK